MWGKHKLTAILDTKAIDNTIFIIEITETFERVTTLLDSMCRFCPQSSQQFLWQHLLHFFCRLWTKESTIFVGPSDQIGNNFFHRTIGQVFIHSIAYFTCSLRSHMRALPSTHELLSLYWFGIPKGKVTWSHIPSSCPNTTLPLDLSMLYCRILYSSNTWLHGRVNTCIVAWLTFQWRTRQCSHCGLQPSHEFCLEVLLSEAYPVVHDNYCPCLPCFSR